MNLLETTKLCKSYSGRAVVKEVSFVLVQEEIVGLLRRNGAGKTTTFRMILGMVTPDSGAVAFDGTDITHLPMYKPAPGIGYLSQERSDFRKLSVWQNLQAILRRCIFRQRHRRAITPGAVRADEDGESARRHAQRRRTPKAETPGAGDAASTILLDEPFSGVDPIAVQDLQVEVDGCKEFGKSVLITDHNVEQTLKVCDRALIIVDGEVMAEGTQATGQ